MCGWSPRGTARWLGVDAEVPEVINPYGTSWGLMGSAVPPVGTPQPLTASRASATATAWWRLTFGPAAGSEADGSRTARLPVPGPRTRRFLRGPGPFRPRGSDPGPF